MDEIIVRNQATHDMAYKLVSDVAEHYRIRLEEQFVGHKFHVYISFDRDQEEEYLEAFDTINVSVDSIDGLLYLVDDTACSMTFSFEGGKQTNIITIDKRPIPIEKLEQFVSVLSKETGIKASIRVDDVKRYYDSVIRTKE
jgi:hypothetical protein